jgi:glycine cleavage system H protein
MRLYTKDHAWVEADGVRARVGISDFAQSELGDIAYVELPGLSGVVVAVNSLLSTDENCALVNRDPLGEGWLVDIEMQDPDELKLLLAEEEYAAYTRGA